MNKISCKNSHSYLIYLQKIKWKSQTEFLKNTQTNETVASNDIEKQLKEELEGLNKRDKELVVLDTNAKHTIFILSGNSDPNQVVTSIFEVGFLFRCYQIKFLIFDTNK